MEERTAQIEAELEAVQDDLKTYETNPAWEEIPSTHPERSRIRLFAATSDSGTYLLKASGILKGCRAEQILKLNLDNDYTTRKQWETGELAGIEELSEIHETLKVIRYYINAGVFLVAQREFVGLQWWDYDEQEDMYTLIFKSTDYSDLVPLTPGTVLGTCLSILQLRNLPKEKGEERHAITVYTYVTPNGWIPNWIIPLWKEKLRDRLLYYERVATTTFTEIYKE